MLAALLATIFALAITSVPAAADDFYFSRTRALFDAEGGATGLFRWNDLTRSQSQIGGDGSYAHFSDGTLISLRTSGSAQPPISAFCGPTCTL